MHGKNMNIEFLNRRYHPLKESGKWSIQQTTLKNYIAQ